MSTATAGWRRRTRWLRQRSATARRVCLRVLFGDRVGLVVFLACLCFVGLFWRVGTFINDNHTLINALVALSEGHLYIEDPVIGTLEAPGTYLHDGRAYGRNYGQLVYTLPFLWGIQALATVADLGVLLPALWSLLVLALAVQIGRVTDHERLATLLGAGVALIAFAANVAVAHPVQTRVVPLLALQASAAVAAGLTAVLVYRLLGRMHGTRIAVAGGLATVVVSPVGFWATVPKRHVYVVALGAGIVYAFYRSRHRETDGFLSATGFRLLAYVLVGAATWVNGAEGLLLLVGLVVVDLPTASSNDARTLVLIGVALTLSLLPFFATNTLVSGHPLRPPEVLSPFSYPTAENGTAPSASQGGPSSDTLDPNLPPFLGRFEPLLVAISAAFSRFSDQFEHGVRLAVTEPGKILHTFVRGRYVEDVVVDDHSQSVSLAVTEAMPLAGALVGLVPALVASGRRTIAERGQSLSGVRGSPSTATDGLVVAVAILFAMFYLPSFPLNAQVTARYLLILYPSVLYGIARQSAVRRALETNWNRSIWAYACGVLLGTQLLLAVVVGSAFGRGQAIQFHAWLGLGAASLLAAVTVGSTLDDRFDPILAVLLGIAAALGTSFLLLSGISYFQYGQYALPVVETISRHVAVG